MFGKNHKRWMRILTWVLAIAVIASMLAAYFSLLF
jgi:hypothetical protein